MPDNETTTTTTTTTGGNMFDHIDVPTDRHALATAVVYDVGDRNGQTLADALTSIGYSLPMVVQQRSTDRTRVILAMQIVARDRDSGEISVRLFDDARSVWQRNVITVRVADFYGSDWFIIRTSQPAPPARMIPRTADGALAAAEIVRAYLPDETRLPALLTEAARWLPGGELNQRGHDAAAANTLCGEYETVVCATFGWLPRRGSESRPARLIAEWESELARIESAAPTPADALQAFVRRFVRGGIANRAVVDHADAHLESHKREPLNELLTGVLDWEPIPTEPAERDYEITVEVTRQFTARQTVTVTVTGEDEDCAAEMIDSEMLTHAISDSDWEIDWEGTSRYDIDDWEIGSVDEI